MISFQAIDTGTTLIYVPADLAANFYGSVRIYTVSILRVLFELVDRWFTASGRYGAESVPLFFKLYIFIHFTFVNRLLRLPMQFSIHSFHLIPRAKVWNKYDRF
jgi:hypothetical protein